MDIGLSASCSAHVYGSYDEDTVYTYNQGANGTAATMNIAGNGLKKITLAGISVNNPCPSRGRNGTGSSSMTASYCLTITGDGRTLFNSSSWSAGQTIDITGVNSLSYNLRITSYYPSYGGDDFRNQDYYQTYGVSSAMTLSNY